MSNQQTTYWCYFELLGVVQRVKSTKGIEVFKDGFWINRDKELTTGSDCVTWIPPTRIRYIDKQVSGGRKAPTSEWIFYHHIKSLIKNLLVTNVNYSNKYFMDEHYTIFNLKKDTIERANYVLEEIEKTKHLIGLEDK